MISEIGLSYIMQEPAEEETSPIIPPGQERHLCKGCTARMSKFDVDRHSKCIECRGQACDVDLRCPECQEWPEAFMIKYVKYLKVLQRKRDSKRKQRGKSDSLLSGTGGDQDVSGSELGESDSAGATLVELKNYVDSKLDDINEGWETKFNALGHQISSHFSSKFSELVNKLSDRSFPAPSSPAVEHSLDKRGPNASPVNPQYGKGLGVHRVEQRPGVLSNPPHVLKTVPVHVPGVGRGRSLGHQVPKKVAGSVVTPTPTVGKGRGFIFSDRCKDRYRQMHHQEVLNDQSFQDIIDEDQVKDDDPDIYIEEYQDPYYDDDDYDDDDEVPEEVPEEPEPQVPDPEEDVVPEKDLDPDSIQFKELVNWVHYFCPNSRSLKVEEPYEPSESEGIFIPCKEKSKYSLRLPLFRAFRRTREKIITSSKELIEDPKKDVASLMSHARGIYQLSDDETNYRPPKPNFNVSRLLSSSVSKRTRMPFSVDEVVRMESVLFSIAETQSFAMWLLSALLKSLRGLVSSPDELCMLERLCRSITSANIKIQSFVVKMSIFLGQARKDFYMSHMSPAVLPDQKVRLALSDPFCGYLFEPDLLSEIIKEHQGEVQVQANVNMAKTIAEAIPVLTQTRGVKRKFAQVNQKIPQGVVGVGSPLTGPPSTGSGASAPRFAGRRMRKRGRGRGDRGRGGVQPKGNPNASGNPAKGFQS